MDWRRPVRPDTTGAPRLVKITAKGVNLASSVQTEVAKAQERTVAPLTAKERDELLRLLRKIAEENNLLSRAPDARRPPPVASST